MAMSRADSSFTGCTTVGCPGPSLHPRDQQTLGVPEEYCGSCLLYQPTNHQSDGTAPTLQRPA